MDLTPFFLLFGGVTIGGGAIIGAVVRVNVAPFVTVK